MRRFTSCCMIAAVVLSLAGCREEPARRTASSWIDPSVTRFHALGWLGGRAHPATRTVEIIDEDGAESAVGGMVIIEVDSDGPLAAAGVIRGDVIVRVGSTWLPIKDDPSLDFIRAVESEVSARVSPIPLFVLRKGRVAELKLAHEMEPMEVGLPAASKRLEAIARAGMRKLVDLQRDDGSFGDASGDLDQKITTSSMAGLALIAGGAADRESEFAPVLKRCRSSVHDALGDDNAEIGPWALAWATMFLAESQGPLPLTGGSPMTFSSSQPFEMSGAMPEMHGGKGVQITRSFSFSSDGEMPENFDLEELHKNGGVGIMVMGSGGLSGMHGVSAGATVAKSDMPDEPLWSFDQVETLAGAETVKRLELLTKLVERLTVLQQDDGGWDAAAERLGYSQRTITTNQALLALGMAQRAGVPISGAALKRGLKCLRKATNDGHVFAVNDAGFDRRLEAGRSSGAGAALMSLNCHDSDEFLRELASFSDKNARTIATAKSRVSLHVLNTAILRRQRGRAAWAAFFEEFRDLIVSLQRRDGSFDQIPTEQASTNSIGEQTRRTAMWTLVAALQNDRTPLLTAKASNPLQREITSDGQLVQGGASGMPAAGMTMDPEQARKMLEGMGIDLDEMMKQAIEGSGGKADDDQP